MTRLNRVCRVALICSLSLWAGTLLMTGVAAAVIFPAMKALEPIVPALDPASRPHWLYIGGKAAAGVFTISNWVQVTLALLGGIGLAGLLGAGRLTGKPRAALLTAYGLPTALLAGYLLLLWPRMRANLHAYWDALTANKLEAAQAAQRAFDADHPLSTTVMSSLFMLTLIGATAAAWLLLSPTERRA